MTWAASRRLDRPFRRSETSAPVAAPWSAAHALREPGRPLELDTRRFLETRFSHDFSAVRVHTGPLAATAARELGAEGFAAGRHVVVGERGLDLDSPRGRGLLAHELAHVVAEGGGEPSASLEVEPVGTGADRAAETIVARAARASEAPSPLGSYRTGRVLRATRNYELTFDDGPHAAPLGTGKNRTEMVLDTLKTKGAIKAGFFVQTGVSYRGGNPVGEALIARMHQEGHTVGIHTGGPKDHELHTTAEQAGRLAGELTAAKAYVKRVTGEEATLVRPPTGKSGAAVEATYKGVGLTNLLWDIDGDEGRSLGLAALKRRFTRELAPIAARGWTKTRRPDAVVVLYHEIQKGTANNIGAVIDHITDETKRISGGKDTAAFRAP